MAVLHGEHTGDAGVLWQDFNDAERHAISGYLDAEGADEYLPRVLSDVLEGRLNALINSIFQDELYSLYQRKDISYKEA